MFRVNVKISGTQEELAKLRKLGDKLTNFSQALKTTGVELKDYYSNQVFDSEGGALGERWAQLSPVYRSWKGNHYPGKGILVASGTLKSSVRAKSSSTTLTIDNPTPYFEYLQLGTRRMQPRPMLAINTDVKNVVKRIFEDDINDKLRAV